MGKKARWIIGIDEVGRGPLAGPITVAAIVMPMKHGARSMKHVSFAGIRDSKKLSPLKRQEWSRRIREAYAYTISSVSPRVLDRIGIARAAHRAVTRCLAKLEKRFTLHVSRSRIVLDGGLRAPACYTNQQTIIRGDERVPIIAAASIVAKVHRDWYMVRLAKKFPQYGFEKHKGYGTKAHCAAIRAHGLSQYHRGTFCRNITQHIGVSTL